MFERPTGPRSGSLEKRMEVWTVFTGLSGMRQNHIQNLTAKELREAIFESEKVLAMLNRQHRIRLEQSHKVAITNGT